MSVNVAVTFLKVIRLVSTGKVYRNKAVSLLELFYLSNLGILAAVLQVNDSLFAATTVSISLSFIVFVGTLLHHLHQETKLNRLYKMIKKKFSKKVVIITKLGSTDKQDKNVIPKQGTTTSYFEFRESLIDSTV